MNITIQCPYCNAEMDAPIELLGKQAECPKCQKQIIVQEFKKPLVMPTQKNDSTNNHPDVSMKPAQAKKKLVIDKRDLKYATHFIPQQNHNAGQQEEGGGCVCFGMGFFFSFIGVLIGYMIGKNKGAKAAAIGMLVAIPFVIIAWIIVFSMNLL